MTVSHRKRQQQPDEIQAVNEPGLEITCDGCMSDLTHSVRMKCADPICDPGDGVDICPRCFCDGKEFGDHKRSHPYRVIELHSYPIFEEDWGADEELLLIEGISLQGLGNWQAVSEHIGTRTKEQVQEHYTRVYVDSSGWPLPRMDRHFQVDPSEFQERKRRRISTMDSITASAPKVPPTSAPGMHEVATFLPGRLEFEHELDNEAEDLVKDLEFGVCLSWGGDNIPEDENDNDVKARRKWEEERLTARQSGTKGPVKTAGKYPGKRGMPGGKAPGKSGVPGKWLNMHGNGVNGHAHTNGTTRSAAAREKEAAKDGSDDDDKDDGDDEPTQPPPIETDDSLQFKLTLIKMYLQRVDKRKEAKAVMFDRGLLDYKKMQAVDKKRPKEEKDVIHRLRPFSRLQTGEDFEEFCTDILYESMLRKRIQELQLYRRLGLRSAADVEKYDADVAKRAHVKANLSRDDYYRADRQHLRAGSSRPDVKRHGSILDSENDFDGTPRPSGPVIRRQPAPLNLANSPSLHLLTPAEQALCSTLRILPKPYLVIKETLVREYARRGGKLRRREARDLVKIDVNKTSRVWDFLVQAGYLRINLDNPNGVIEASASPTKAQAAASHTQAGAGPSAPTAWTPNRSVGSAAATPLLPSATLPTGPSSHTPQPGQQQSWNP